MKGEAGKVRKALQQGAASEASRRGFRGAGGCGIKADICHVIKTSLCYSDALP